MKSTPAASAMRARRRHSGQLADHRSGTLVAERPEEQLAPKTPILSALPLYRLVRSRIDAVRASKAFSVGRNSIVPPGREPVNAPPRLPSCAAAGLGIRVWGCRP